MAVFQFSEIKMLQSRFHLQSATFSSKKILSCRLLRYYSSFTFLEFSFYQRNVKQWNGRWIANISRQDKVLLRQSDPTWTFLKFFSFNYFSISIFFLFLPTTPGIVTFLAAGCCSETCATIMNTRIDFEMKIQNCHPAPSNSLETRLVKVEKLGWNFIFWLRKDPKVCLIFISRNFSTFFLWSVLGEVLMI